MATSGSTDYNVTRDDIITEALMILGVLGEGESPNANQLTDFSRTLNMMIKSWQADDINLWLIQKGYLFLAKDTSSYSLGPSGDNATTSYVKTELSADVSSGGTSLTVDSITGISNGDYIGIVLDSGALHWDTVNGAPSGSTVTLTTGLAGDAATDNNVYAYTTKVSRPLRLTDAWLRDDSAIDTTLNICSREEYETFSDKGSDGQVTNIYYDPQRTNGILYVYPQTDLVTDFIVFNFVRPVEDFDAATDDADYPQEWYQALCWGLAALKTTMYGVAKDVRKDIVTMAETYKQRAMDFDVEKTSMYLQPDFW